IAASGNYYTYSLALKSDGTVWAWGDNTYGQLGDGTTTRRLTPVRVSGLSGVAAIDAGNYSAMALKTNGTVWDWGYNVYGQLGDGTTINRSTPVQVKLSDGSALENVIDIDAGSNHAVALKSDGSVWAWGSNGYGQLGIPDPNIYPEEVTGLAGVTNVAAGSSHTVALKTDGTVWAWGYNTSGQVGDGTTTTRNAPVQVKLSGGAPLSGVAGIAARDNRTVAWKTDGTVWAWGENFFGQLGDGTTITRLNPVQVIMQDGTALSNVTAVAAGSSHTLALKEDGTVWAWGNSSSGEIGDGTQYTNRLNPVQVLMADRTPLSGVVAIAAGQVHSLAVQEDGSVWAWGYNYWGQLGDGTTTTRLNPVEIPDFFGVVVIGAGNYHTVAIRERQPSVRVSASVKGVTVPEGGTATFQVKLTAAPAATVTVIATRTSGDADIMVQSGTNLTFTTANWSTYQTVTLAAAQDADTENGSAVISLMGVDVGAVVTATENDNDAPLTVGAGAGGTAAPVGITNVTKYSGMAIVATPDSGYVFDNWSVVSGVASFGDPLISNTTVTIHGPAVVQAGFTPAGVNRSPTITSAAWTDSSTVRLPAGTVVHVAASDRDDDPLTYTWSAVNDADNVTFAAGGSADSAVSFSASGFYVLRVTVSDGRGGSAISEVSVTVKPVILPPTITQQPAGHTVCKGQEALFWVNGTGEERSYQWYRNGVPISSAVGSTFSIENTILADNGAKFKVVVTNPAGSVTSDEVTLTVLDEATGTGLKGEYFNNVDFTELLLTRVDPNIQFGSYGGWTYPFPLDTFSVRWTGQVRPKYSETYTFETTHQGGVRLWVNGVMLISAWDPANDRSYKRQGTILLEAGRRYDIQFEYGGISEQGNVQLEWSSAHSRDQFNNMSSSQMYPAKAPVTLVTSPSVVSVPEGGTNTFQVKLPAQPAGDVTVDVSFVSGDTDISVQSGENLVFTTNNWDTYQTVTLAAANDGDITNGTATIICSASGMSNATVTAVEVDKSTILTLLAGPGGTVSPAGATQVDRLVATQIVATASPGYRLANWATAVGSAIIGDANATSTTVTIDAPATLVANFVQQLSILTSVADLSVPESGTATFGVKLSLQPAGSVVVAVARTAGDS
ncbi:MAG: hypothetical protein FJ222_12395, partial [Lentisphaerae bacterium]|nr:hypothetical protein [Lentisphaerota bacterium]